MALEARDWTNRPASAMLFAVKPEESPNPEPRVHPSEADPRATKVGVGRVSRPDMPAAGVGRVSRPDTPGAKAASRLNTGFVLLAFILFVAFPIRLYLARSAVMLSRDGVTFIWYAQHLAQHPLAEMRKQDQHPLYPAMILAAHSALQALGKPLRPLSGSVRAALDDPVQSWTLAGMTVTLLGGLAVVWAVYVLTRQLFNRRVGLLAAMLVALSAEFCQLSADALTDMPHLALYLFALCAAIRALRPLSTVVSTLPPQLGGATPACPPLVSGGEGGLFGQQEAPPVPLSRLPASRVLASRVPLLCEQCSPNAPRTADTGEGDQGACPNERLSSGDHSPVAPPRLIPWLFLSGLLSGLAFLMRPEGAGVAVIAVLGVLMLARRWRFRRRLAGVLAVMIGAALVASPYMLITGKLVQKKALPQFFRFLMPASWEPNAAGAEKRCQEEFLASAKFILTPFSDRRMLAMADPAPLVASAVPARLAKAAGQILEHWGRSLRGTLLLPAIAWLFLRRRMPAQATALRLILAAGMLHVFILFALILMFNYEKLFSIRHTMILAGLTLPFAAAGMAAVLDLVPAPRRPAAGVLIVLALIAPTAPWLFERPNADSAYLRRAGEWIRTQQPCGAKIHTTQHPVAFYANGVWQWSPLDADIPRMLFEARANRPDWLVFDLQRMLRMSPSFLLDLERAARPGELERVPDTPSQQAKGRIQRAIIYRYHPPA